MLFFLASVKAALPHADNTWTAQLCPHGSIYLYKEKQADLLQKESKIYYRSYFFKMKAALLGS